MPTAMADQTAITTFSALRERARQTGMRRVAVVAAEDEIALTAASLAVRNQVAVPVLIGSRAAIDEIAAIDNIDISGCEFVDATPQQAAELAVQMAREGGADILLKGHLRTDQLLKAVLDKETGLRTGRLLSDVLLYEDVLGPQRRLVGITDGGLNVAPTLDQKRQIVLNALEVLRAIGISQPNVAIMSATEAVSDSVPSTKDAEALTKMCEAGEFGDAVVYGPLALDNALLESAARAKGISHPVAGHADCMVAPTIEAGNLLGKAVKYYAGSQCAHVVVGAKVPILIPSRVESADDKLNAIALGVIYAGR